MNLDKVPVHWIESTSEFEKIAADWLKVKLLAIDTEFERRTTYFPKLALVQVFDGQSIYLIDPLKARCNDSFRQVCADQKIIKVMHSAKEDLEVFFHSWGCQFESLFDTQVGYTFYSGEISIGYANIVEKYCGVSLNKQATQSDWLARPLSQAQLNYAAADVLYLPKVYQQVSEQLAQVPQELFSQECKQLTEQVKQQPDYAQDYRQAGDACRLDGKSLHLFKLLYQWREETAISQDRTRNHIAKDVQLVDIALRKPQTKNDLAKIDGLHPRSVRQYHQQIIEIVERHPSLDELKPVPNPRELPELKPLSQKFAQQAKLVAKALQIDASVIASKRLLKKVAFAYLTQESFPALWCSWRKQYLKPHFDREFAEFNTRQGK
ncbi:ribonuclease D [Aliikangiella sp. IMCC44632]